MSVKKLAPAENIERLAKKYKEATQGYRLKLYSICQEMMASVIEMRANPLELKRFMKRYGIDAPKSTESQSWITEAAFSTLNPASAWKAARACEFLVDIRKVPLEELAARLKKLGGIEKTCFRASVEDPRHVSAKRRSTEKPGAGVFDRSAETLERLNSKAASRKSSHSYNQSDDAGAESISDAADEYAYMTVRLRRPRLDKILALAKGRQFSLTCRRRSEESDDGVKVAVSKYSSIKD